MSEIEKLPPGWIKVKSKSRGKYYYFHAEKRISVWHLKDCLDPSKVDVIKVASPLKTPKKSPNKEHRLSSQSINVGKKNLANQRLKKLTETLKNEAKNLVNNELIINKKEVPQSNEVPQNGTSKVPANLSIPGKKNKKKRNLANKRLKKLQETLKDGEESAEKSSTVKTNRKEVSQAIETKSKNKQENVAQTNGTSKKPTDLEKTQSSLPKNTSSKKEVIVEEEVVRMEVDEPLDKSIDSLKDFEEEPMEWEDIDEKFVVQQVHNVRTKENVGTTSSFAPRDTNGKVSMSDFYIIVDTNVLISNLSFVKQIKSKLFKDIGRAYIYLPYVVLCELDRLKMREENNIAKLARCAISYIDDCFKSKDEFILGQNALESSRELIQIDSGDDYIINSALQLKASTNKIILLSNDKNLRNKAFVNGIEAFSSDTLNYADYNVSNSITFE